MFFLNMTQRHSDAKPVRSWRQHSASTVPKLSLTIPCFNEADNLPRLLEKLSHGINRSDIEIIIVDNGSTDKTDEVLRRLLQDYPFARSIRIEKNKGYGNGVLAGLHSSDSDFVGWTHGDLQTDPQDIIRGLELLERIGNNEKGYAKGYRVNRPWSDRVFSLGMSAVASMALNTSLAEINAQPNLFSRSLLSHASNPPEDFSLDLYIYYIAKRNGFKIERFRVRFKERIFGVSNWNTGIRSRLRFIYRTFQYIVSLRNEIRNSKPEVKR